MNPAQSIHQTSARADRDGIGVGKVQRTLNGSGREDEATTLSQRKPAYPNPVHPCHNCSVGGMVSLESRGVERVSDLPLVHVHLLPSMIRPGSMRGGIAVVADVLRATTVMVHALAAGADAIVPCLEIDEARAIAHEFPKNRVILAGERYGLPIDGFDLGNSPRSFSPDVCAGKTVVTTTTNGTRAIHTALGADRVLIAAFANLEATLKQLRSESRAIHLIGSGTNGRVSLEDSLLVGALADGLRSTHSLTGNDEAALASAAWRSTRGESLVDVLKRGSGGRRVLEIALEADLETAADLDRFDFVAEVVRDPIRIVRRN